MTYLHVMDLEFKTRQLQEFVDILFIGFMTANTPIDEVNKIIEPIIVIGNLRGIDIDTYITYKLTNYLNSDDASSAIRNGLSAILDKVDEGKMKRPNFRKGGVDYGL